ncbi:hypothetical protein F2Q69_00028142 [Brassica cretica]|uniref:Uncharacterized protein n=1 Tax=Brassica cretica TaxID=69181 RepID=A0A8S9SBU7_BRACR|nr:hypothetical protein F2Q69_00028142 [Brassica cretica]
MISISNSYHSPAKLSPSLTGWGANCWGQKRKIGSERTSESRTKATRRRAEPLRGKITGELNHHVGQLAAELNRRVVILARQAQPSRRSPRRRAEPSRGCARR